MPISLQYRVIPGAVKAAFYELHNPEEQIESYVATEARAVAAAKTFDQLYTDRDEFTQTVRESLDEALNDYGYEIRPVLLDDPRPQIRRAAWREWVWTTGWNPGVAGTF